MKETTIALTKKQELEATIEETDALAAEITKGKNWWKKVGLLLAIFPLFLALTLFLPFLIAILDAKNIHWAMVGLFGGLLGISAAIPATCYFFRWVLYLPKMRRLAPLLEERDRAKKLLMDMTEQEKLLEELSRLEAIKDTVQEQRAKLLARLAELQGGPYRGT